MQEIQKLKEQCEFLDDQIKEKKKELQKAYEKEMKNNAPKCSEKSQKIVNDMLDKGLKHIFYLLDSDRDGIISFKTLDTVQLPKIAQLALDPFLTRIKDLKLEQNFEQFYNEVVQIFKVRFFIKEMPIKDLGT